MPVGWGISNQGCQQGLARVCLMKMVRSNASCQAVALFIVTAPGRWRRVNGPAGPLDVITSTTSLWNMDVALFWDWMGGKSAKRPRIIEYRGGCGGVIIILEKCLLCCCCFGMACISWCLVGGGHRLLEAEERRSGIRGKRALTEETPELWTSRRTRPLRSPSGLVLDYGSDLFLKIISGNGCMNYARFSISN